jgi:hypothetical protein
MKNSWWLDEWRPISLSLSKTRVQRPTHHALNPLDSENQITANKEGCHPEPVEGSRAEALPHHASTSSA